MAIVYATKTGNWSDTTVWNTGALPGAEDNVYSNGFIVTINTSPTVLSISNAAVASPVITLGGYFVATNGITLRCTATNGLDSRNNGLLFSSSLGLGQSCTILANCVSPANGAYCAVNSGAGTLNVTGNCTGSERSLSVVYNSGTGTTNILGNCISATGGAGGGTYGASCINGTLNITGDCIGGAVNGAGAANQGGILNITGGTCIGGSGSFGVLHTAGTTVITGACLGGTGSYGIVNSGSGTLTHIGTVQASATTPAIGPGSATQVTILTGPLLCNSPNDASAGVNPCIALRWFPADTALSTFQYQMRGATASGSPSVRPVRQLFLTDAYSSGYPAVSNVNNGSTYGPAGIYAGTMNIPNSSTVSFGVPVGVTTGTMIIPTMESIWNYPISGITTSGSIGERLKTAATVSTVNTILSNALR
jgi:hypothetical protein